MNGSCCHWSNLSQGINCEFADHHFDAGEWVWRCQQWNQSKRIDAFATYKNPLSLKKSLISVVVELQWRTGCVFFFLVTAVFYQLVLITSRIGRDYLNELRASATYIWINYESESRLDFGIYATRLSIRVHYSPRPVPVQYSMIFIWNDWRFGSSNLANWWGVMAFNEPTEKRTLLKKWRSAFRLHYLFGYVVSSG